MSGPQLIKYLMTNGVMAALNQSVDFDTAALAADHFGFEAESEEAVAEQAKDTSPAEGRRKHPLIDLSNAAPGTLVAPAADRGRARPCRPWQDIAP